MVFGMFNGCVGCCDFFLSVMSVVGSVLFWVVCEFRHVGVISHAV